MHSGSEVRLVLLEYKITDKQFSLSAAIRCNWDMEGWGFSFVALFLDSGLSQYANSWSCRSGSWSLQKFFKDSKCR